MAKYIALLRGINVGGRSLVAMADLRALVESAGFTEVETLLQSGNVIFSGMGGSSPAIEKKLEAAVEKKFGRHIEFFVRDKGSWENVIEGNPFADEAKRDPSHLVALCLKAMPTAEALVALKAAIVGREAFRAGKRCLYLYYPDGIGTSKLTNAIIERKLGMSGTARNWNTVLKIAVSLAGSAGR